MKSIIIILNLFVILPVLSQTDARSTNEGFMKGSITKGNYRNKSINPSPPEGSPYLDKNFTFANVNQKFINQKMRYNIYKDEFEFISPSNDTIILDKNENFDNITFITTNTIYKLFNYINILDEYCNGYLIHIYQKGDVGLFKKENIYLSEEKISRTSMEKNMPAKYHNSSTVFFLKLNKIIIEFPDNKKKLTKILPSKKEAIENFVKENRIDFDKEIDKIRIIDFLSVYKFIE